MKKLATLLLAAGLVFGAATGAQAIDFKAKGQWIMTFDLGHGSMFMNKSRSNALNDARGSSITGWGGRGSNNNGDDNFSAGQRVRLALEAVASEFLSGTVQFEMGHSVWGRGQRGNGITHGAAMGADGVNIEVKHAYLDWVVPNTDLKVRMGLQGIALPAFTTGGSQILADDVAGIVLSNKFNDNVSLAFIWARPYNDNFGGSVDGRANNFTAGYADNVDLFALLLPMSFDGVKVTPWAMLGFIGPNAFRNTNDDNSFFGNVANGQLTGNRLGVSDIHVATGMLPAAWSTHGDSNGANRFSQYGTAFWFGLTGEVTAWDPFRLAWDFNIGTVNYGKSRLNRGGWYLALLAEYKLDWGTPGLYGWYSSGDDSNPRNGSERMPTLYANGDNDFSWFAGNGNPYIAREGVGFNTMVGTWGIGARIKDMSFLEGLKHTLRVNYFQGTNSSGMARYIRGAQAPGRGDGDINRFTSRLYTDFNTRNDLYLTQRDSALEIGLSNSYKIYENLTLMVDLSYLGLWLDTSGKVWGNNGGRYPGVNNNTAGHFSGTDAWNINASFVYQF